MENFESYSLLPSAIAQRMLGGRGDVEDLVNRRLLGIVLYSRCLWSSG